MASKRLSPAANLLRRSKLFSLPPPLRTPPAENPGSRNEKYSETATLPYPTRAAIETTPRALLAGEWGLKRALPGKAGRSSTPFVRIHAFDNSDHITDYDSAADHVLTLEKWQEMDIPITQSEDSNPQSSGTLPEGRGALSVFEFEHGRGEAQKQKNNLGDVQRRWRYEGPWLLGMSPMHFEQYVDEHIERRRPEFMNYLRRHLSNKKNVAGQRTAVAKGTGQRAVDEHLTEKEFRNGIQKLRTERLELWGLIWKFLDIPGQPPTRDPNSTTFSESVRGWFSDQDDSPPQTHPSAGLSYSRTSNHVYNHPALGPQRVRPPVHGRIVKHGNVVRAEKDRASLVGVGGVVGTQGTDSFSFTDNARSGEHKFDSEVEGGSKMWVVPSHASIDPNGRINLTIEKATSDTVAVWEHQVPPGTSFDTRDPLAALAKAEQSDRRRANTPARSFEQLFSRKPSATTKPA